MAAAKRVGLSSPLGHDVGVMLSVTVEASLMTATAKVTNLAKTQANLMFSDSERLASVRDDSAARDDHCTIQGAQ